MANDPINPKVTASAVGGAVGGGTVTLAMIHLMQKAFGASPDWFSPEVIVTMTSIIGGIVGFISGWLKKYMPAD